ncbi:MAG: hypothetical protein JSV74_03265 [Dehalococcoidia bacterium]|nr:MAG: hypothetical protein JSV74_03265 [Dehalococcoidia bacterium]
MLPVDLQPNLMPPAYIDPGTGSLVIQVIIGTVAGALLTIKVFWNRIKLFISNLFAKNPNKTEDDE